MSSKRAPLPADLMAQKPTVNAAAVPAPAVAPQDPAPVAATPPAPAPVAAPIPPVATAAPEPAPAPAPAPEAEAEEVAPQPTPQPAPAAPAPTTIVQIIKTVVEEPGTELQPVVIHAPVHARSVKKRDSQMSFTVDGDKYRRIDYARFETGLTAQKILTEAIDMWLAHNQF